MPLVPDPAGLKGKRDWVSFALSGLDRQRNAGLLTLQGGVPITVRMLDTVSSKGGKAGDSFKGVLEEPLWANGVIVAQKNSSVTGRVVLQSRTADGDELGLELVSVQKTNGEMADIVTEPLVRMHGKSVGSRAIGVASTTAFGTAVGAVAGGARGAALGAAAGALLGSAGASLPGDPVEFKAESVLLFRARGVNSH